MTEHSGKTAAEGKVALVTGGARRVGREVVRALAGAGMDVMFTYLNSEREALALQAELRAAGRRCVAMREDHADPETAERVFTLWRQSFDRLDVLVNNASVFRRTPFGSIGLQDIEQQMAINARAPLLLIQKFAPLLAAHYHASDPASTGRVVNFIDIHVMGEPLRHFCAYNASKAALMEITATCAMELAPAVTVNAIAPGVVAWAEDFSEQERFDYLTKVPLARAGTPLDAATATLFLVRDAHYCTGQTIRLDGGRLLV